MREELAWYDEWLWVGGYSSFTTLIIISNMILLFSVGKNKYLHFSFHYVMIAVALRNIVRVTYSLLLVIFTKVVGTDWLYKFVYQLAPSSEYSESEVRQSQGLPNTCQVLCCADTFLTTVVMFYIASLAVYLLCRPANPTIVKPYGAAESWWVGALVVLLPPCLSCLACLPAPFLQSSHLLTPLPKGELCQDDQQKPEVLTYLTSVSIMGFLLPLAIIICSSLVLIIRRCVACGRKCCSSFCKEELALVLVSTVYTLTQLAMYLPILDIYLAKSD